MDSTPNMVEVDNVFYSDTLHRQGKLYFIDHALAFDPSTRGIVNKFARRDEAFKKSFADAMTKMGRIEVLVGEAGEIRKKCNVTNS